MTYQKKGRGIPVVEWRKKMHRLALVAKQESRIHIVAECELYKDERDILEEEMREVKEGDKNHLTH